MKITELKGVSFNRFGATKENLPPEWTILELDFKLKNHRLAKDHEKTRIIEKIIGWTNSRWAKPIFEYYTDTLDLVNLIKKYGEVPLSILFIKES